MDFELFALDMGPRPTRDHTIERIDSNGDYEPGNCKWATRKEQAMNTCRNRKLEFEGKTMTVTQWAAKLGVPSYVIFSRIYLGWTVADALTRPVRS